LYTVLEEPQLLVAIVADMVVVVMEMEIKMKMKIDLKAGEVAIVVGEVKAEGEVRVEGEVKVGGEVKVVESESN
jgi:hypothetical protein